MTDDVRLATGFRHHRKTRRLKRRLGDSGVLSLIYLWAWAGASRWTGDLKGLTDEDIEDEAGWDGEPGALVLALVDVGFLEGKAGHRKLHDWLDWNPYAAGKGRRIARSKKGTDARWGTQGELDLEGIQSNSMLRSQRLAAARAVATHTPEEWEALQASCGGRCVRCGAEGALVRKHIIPIYQSGSSDGIGNIQPFCRRCASASGHEQGDLRPPDWAKRMQQAGVFTHQAGVEHAQNDENACTPAPAPTPSESDGARALDAQAQQTAEALQAAGCGDAHEHDPRLRSALDEGLMLPLIALASTKKGKGKSLAYLVATVRGQRSDAQEAQSASHSENSPVPDVNVQRREDARRDLDNTLIEIRHLHETSHMIDDAERDRRIAQARARYRKAVGEPADDETHRSQRGDAIAAHA